jgi:hypothetical protein
MFDSDRNPLKAIENSLRAWVPSVGGLDRDRMLFEAGRAAAQGVQATRRALWLYRLATAAALLLSASMGYGWQRERDQRQALSEALASLQETTQPIDPIADGQAPMSRFTTAGNNLDPSSYLAIMRTMSRESYIERHLPVPDDEKQGRDRRPPTALPQPLRPRNFDRVLTL